MEKGDIYQHYRNQQYYKIIGIGRHTETLEEFVIYIALYFDKKYGNEAIWVRPKSMFLENVEHEGKIVPRFTQIKKCLID
jgi:hypothetical protein